MRIHIKTIIILMLLLVLGKAIPAAAATLFFESDSNSLSLGQEFLVKVFVDTKNDSINAAEGKIVFPSNLIDVREIRDANTDLNFWVEKPHISDPGEISYSGVTPGGFQGPKIPLFSIVFQVKGEGKGSISAEAIRMLLNDGKGTLASTNISSLSFSVASGAASSTAQVETVKDTVPPENFSPTVASSSAMFGGKYFLVFAAQDKGSGIDHYEVREGSGPFVTTNSPYLLSDQNLDQTITVKAVDKSSNETLATLSPVQPSLWYKNNFILVIIMLFIVALFFRKIGWLKFTKSR